MDYPSSSPPQSWLLPFFSGALIGSFCAFCVQLLYYSLLYVIDALLYAHALVNIAAANGKLTDEGAVQVSRGRALVQELVPPCFNAKGPPVKGGTAGPGTVGGGAAVVAGGGLVNVGAGGEATAGAQGPPPGGVPPGGVPPGGVPPGTVPGDTV